MPFQDEVSLAFRDVVGVPGKIWPEDLTVQRLNETTSAPYLNPIFQSNVTHGDNQCLLDVVVKLVAQRLKVKQYFFAVGFVANLSHRMSRIVLRL
jgi:hypothetical protein